MGDTGKLFAQQAFGSAEDAFRVIFDGAPVGITLTTLDGTFLKANAAFQSMVGYSEDELLRLRGIDLTLDGDARALTARCRAELFSGRRDYYEIEKRYRTRSGSPIWVHVRGALVKDSEGHPRCTVAMVQDITAARQATESLKSSETQLRRLLEERENLNRDLHDNIAQSLYAIGMGLEGCGPLVQRDPGYVTAQLAQAIGGLNNVIRDVRCCIDQREASVLGGSQLRTGLETLVRDIGERHTPRFRFHLDERALSRLTPQQAQQFLYIAREALSNALKHSGAKRGMLLLRNLEHAIQLEVSDDGSGFDAHGHTGGRGVANMAARAREIGASFECQSRPRSGTRILVRIPTA